MPHLKILIQGYARKENNVLFATPTTVLIKDSRLNILVDPGANKELLLTAFKKEGLKPEDIDIVFVTHHHLDHLLNIRLFPDKDIYDGATINSDDKMVEYSGNIPNTNIKVIPTPGHAHEHWSLLIETVKGKVVVAGDVFWWYDDEKQRTDKRSIMNHQDSYAMDIEALRKSRRKLIEIADYIIPGHGKRFIVEK